MCERVSNGFHSVCVCVCVHINIGCCHAGCSEECYYITACLISDLPFFTGHIPAQDTYHCSLLCAHAQQEVVRYTMGLTRITLCWCSTCTGAEYISYLGISSGTESACRFDCCSGVLSLVWFCWCLCGEDAQADNSYAVAEKRAAGHVWCPYWPSRYVPQGLGRSITERVPSWLYPSSMASCKPTGSWWSDRGHCG